MLIKNLTTRVSKLLTGKAYMIVDNGSTAEKVDYAELAKQIITEYNTQTLAGSAQSIKSALDTLNGYFNKGNIAFKLYSVDFSASSPGNLSQLLSLPSSIMRMIVIFWYNGYVFDNSVSIYFVQRGNDGGFYGVQTITKGSDKRTVELSADGTVTKGEENTYNVRCFAIQLTK